MLLVSEVRYHLYLEELAKCEHCGEVLATHLNPEAMIGEQCPSCRGILTEVSFGLYNTDIGLIRTAWLGPEGERVPEKPKSDFWLGNARVVVRRPPVVPV